MPRVPYPLEKGDKLRAYHQLRELSKKHHLIVCALSDEKPNPKAREFLSCISGDIHIISLPKAGILFRLLTALFSRMPFQVAYFYSRSAQKKIMALMKLHQPQHVFCQLIRTAEYGRHLPIDKTLDYQDAFSAGLLRRKQVSPWFLKPLISMEYRRVKRYEKSVFDDFEKKTIISSSDRDLIPHPNNKHIVVVPNGVDMDRFSPNPDCPKEDVLFTGNMAYPPNVDGAEYLAREIMPLVWRDLPGTRLTLAGATPHRKVRNLASDKVNVTGWVDDIVQCYAASSVFVAPMRIGTGQQNKILEAMAMGLPCVASPLANQAIGAENQKEILIGKNAKEYAQQIVSLLRDDKKRREIGTNGHRFVWKHYHWENTTRLLEQLITAQ